MLKRITFSIPSPGIYENPSDKLKKKATDVRKIKNHKDQSTLNKFGHFVNGIFCNTIMIACIQPLFTWKTHKMSGLPLPSSIFKYYNGTIVNALSGGPPEGIAFVTQENFSQKSNGRLYELGISSLAGCVGAPATSALERITIHQQLLGNSARFHIKKIIAKEGVKGVLKGTVPTMWREACFNVGIFALYDIVHDTLFKNANGTYSDIISSTISGGIAGSLSTPFDLIKTRMQVDTEEKFTGLFQTARFMAKTHGAKSLFKGIGLRSVTIGISTCIIHQSEEIIPQFFPNIFHQLT